MSLIKDYFEKTRNYKAEYGEKTIVFMQCGSFFEVYALLNNEQYEISNILDFSKVCDLNIVEKKVMIDEKQVVMAGFKEPYWEKYTKKMQEYGYSVVIFTQDEACPNTTRSLFGIFSPGSFFSESSEQVSNFSCCIWIHIVKPNKINPFSMFMGASFVDIMTGQSFIYEFKENYIHSPSPFDQLEKIISSFCPSETIFVSPFKEKETLDIINFIHLNSKIIHHIYLIDDNNNNNNNNNKRAMKCEKQTYQKEILTQFFEIKEFSVFFEPFLDNPIACQSYCFLLDFLYQHNPYLVNKLTQPQFYKDRERLLMANHSLKQLNIIDSQENSYDHSSNHSNNYSSNHSSKHSCIINLLNNCITNMGKRKFKYDFLNPTINEEWLNKEYNMIEYLSNQPQNKDIENKLQKIFDLSKLKRQIVMKRISPKNIYQLYSSLQNILGIFEIIKNDKCWINYFQNQNQNKSGCRLDTISDKITQITTFMECHFMLEQCKMIDSFQKFDENFIVSGKDPELDKSVCLLQNSELELSFIKNYLNELILTGEKSKKKDAELVKLHETEKNNISLIITDKRSKILQQQLKEKRTNDVIVDYCCALTYQTKKLYINTNADAYAFPKHTSSNKFIHSPQIIELCKNITKLKIEVMENISKAYSNIIANMEKFNTDLNNIEDFIVTIDVLICKKMLVHKFKLSRPIIDSSSENSYLKVKGLRHLLIEAISQNELYVPNDIILGHPDSNSQGILLYGTNAVGKTSFIKSIGIAIIMAQSGLFVPCSELIFKPYSSIFTRLLGADNIFKGLSTFAVEMTELRSILKYSDNNSLVLGDELCSGTESTSAKSIFVAGVKNLYSKRGSFIFATHLHEIVDYDEISELTHLKLKHMSVLFNKEKNRLEYDRIMKDGPGESIYGLEVCKSLDLPYDFLQDANEIRLKYTPGSQSILEQKTSTYNAKKIKRICEKCNQFMATEVHHLIPQKEFNNNNKVEKVNNYTLDKNNYANLYSVCEKCHLLFHKTDDYYKKIKTSDGYDLLPI